jgi:hypothetical protein
MPYGYEFLKNHFSAVHPELLEAFVEGWNTLDPVSQDHWSQQGIITPKVPITLKCWLSWTTTQMDKVFLARETDPTLKIPLSKFENRLAILFHNTMDHAGHLFGFPYMPPLENREYLSPSGEHPSSSERHAIAKDMAKFVIHSELGKILIKWKENVDENGIEALRKAYLTAPQLEEDNEKKFDFKDSDWYLDCDSDSDISDDDEVPNAIIIHAHINQ